MEDGTTHMTCSVVDAVVGTTLVVVDSSKVSSEVEGDKVVVAALVVEASSEVSSAGEGSDVGSTVSCDVASGVGSDSSREEVVATGGEAGVVDFKDAVVVLVVVVVLFFVLFFVV